MVLIIGNEHDTHKNTEAFKEEKQKAKEKGRIYPFECRVPKNSKEE